MCDRGPKARGSNLAILPGMMADSQEVPDSQGAMYEAMLEELMYGAPPVAQDSQAEQESQAEQPLTLSQEIAADLDSIPSLPGAEA